MKSVSCIPEVSPRVIEPRHNSEIIKSEKDISHVIKVASMNFLDNQSCPSENTLKQMEAFLIEELRKYTS